MTMNRRLAAILAADVVGYSRLMEADEAGTHAALTARRKTVLEPLVAKHKGRIVKLMGDGVLAEFASAVNAVQCAAELQQGMTAANAGIPEDQRIVLRIGVNLGDVIVEGEDIYGDGVNIAARIEALAEPGAVYVSRVVMEQTRGKLELEFEDAGEHSLKNIAQPVRVYRVAAPEMERGALPLPDKPSIAVLPFTNMSGDPEQEYFSDGITEDIITELSRFRSLFVIARNSSFTLKGKAVDVKRVGRELGVQFVIEGSVRRSADRLRITAQLIDASTGNHIWAERYDRDMRDIFAVQDELARAVATNAGGRVDTVGRERVARLSPSALNAYDLVLRAKASWAKFSRKDNIAAGELLRRAISLDPTSAPAHAYYAHARYMEYAADWIDRDDVALAEALDLAKRAVTLDGADATARWVLGLIFLYRREYAEAYTHLNMAVELNPNDSEAVVNHAVYLTSVGQSAKAIDGIELSRRRDPLGTAGGPWLLGIAYFTARRYEDAIATLSQIHEPINEVRMWLAASLAQAGRPAEAKVKLQEFLRVAEGEMRHYPGEDAQAWKKYFHRAIEYQDHSDFEHLHEALRKAGLPI
jgi:TolB-like protein